MDKTTNGPPLRGRYAPDQGVISNVTGCRQTSHTNHNFSAEFCRFIVHSFPTPRSAEKAYTSHQSHGQIKNFCGVGRKPKWRGLLHCTCLARPPGPGEVAVSWPPPIKYGPRQCPWIWDTFCLSTYHTLKEKGVLKQCPWGTILENGAFFYKEGTILVPLVHQNEKSTVFQNGAPGAPFSTEWCPSNQKGTILVPFLVKKRWHQNGAPKGTVYG